MRGPTVLLCAIVLAASPLEAQEVRTAVVPDSLTPGDVVRAVIRVLVPRAAQVSFPDSLPVPDDVESAASRVIVRDSVNADTDAVTATYGLTAWRPGPFTLPPVEVVARIEGDDASLEARFPPFAVVSVLPADSAGIEPQPPRGVLGPSHALWPLFLLGAAVLAIVAALAWVLRRRRKPAAPAGLTPPRDRALAELERIRRSGLLESGQYKVFCSAVTDVLRHYLAELEPAWGTDLTTTELAGAMRTEAVERPNRIGDAGIAIPEATDDAASSVIQLLGSADVVKFTGIRGTEAGADSIWERARDWVGTWDAGLRRAA